MDGECLPGLQVCTVDIDPDLSQAVSAGIRPGLEPLECVLSWSPIPSIVLASTGCPVLLTKTAAAGVVAPATLEASPVPAELMAETR